MNWNRRPTARCLENATIPGFVPKALNTVPGPQRTALYFPNQNVRVNNVMKEQETRGQRNLYSQRILRSKPELGSIEAETHGCSVFAWYHLELLQLLSLLWQESRRNQLQGWSGMRMWLCWRAMQSCLQCVAVFLQSTYTALMGEAGASIDLHWFCAHVGVLGCCYGWGTVARVCLLKFNCS